MSTETDERLARIESRIQHIENILAKVEQAILPVLANPGAIMAKMLRPKA